jgi:hypothetical protein
MGSRHARALVAAKKQGRSLNAGAAHLPWRPNADKVQSNFKTLEGPVRQNNKTACRLLLLNLFVLLSGCDQGNDTDPLHKVNGSVHVTAGTALTSAETVNGGIHVGANATVTSLTTVNGGIVLGAGAHVAKSIEAVNGGISLAEGAGVLGSVTNVNGKIVLRSAQVGGGIMTVDGNILIDGTSKVEGGIHVQKPGGLGGIIQLVSSPPRVEIGPGAIVQGELKFDREVKLYVSDKATIGPVVGATAIAFAGDTAPQD